MAEYKVAVAKDMGSHGVVSSVVELLDRRFTPEEIIVVAEGIAAERFQKAGRMLAFAGTRDFRDIPFSLDCERFLDLYTPNVVIIGEGSPINLERRMARAANDRSIPVVALNDFWGGITRVYPARVAVICALDEFDASVAREYHSDTPIHVVGNPGAKKLTAKPAVKERMDELRCMFDDVIAYVGGGESTTQDNALLVESLQKTPGNWCVVPAFHPKHVLRTIPDGTMTFGELWRKQLGPLGDRVKHLGDIGASGDDVVAEATTVISHRSTLMTSAAYMGKRTISIQTPEGLESMHAQSGISVVPHVYLGVTPLLEAPTDLSVFTTTDPETVRSKIFPYDPEKVWDAIKDFF